MKQKKILPVIYRGYTIGYEEADIVVHLEPEPDNMIVLEFKAVSYEPREQEIVQVKNEQGTIRPAHHPSCGDLRLM